MWIEKNNTLQRQFRFKNFVEAWTFMTEVAFHAERLKHHPNWSNVWNVVDIHLNTHDAGGIITEKDYALSAAIDEVFKKFQK
ncbi:MAG: 4a-hydroxytetrahydrobiopterin dehydratase [Saprospiraceae bacterium]|nr:4a-hydroxytetrahydrobiopterin dehydratase [Saprospiraceae bacterium]